MRQRLEHGLVERALLDVGAPPRRRSRHHRLRRRSRRRLEAVAERQPWALAW